MAFEIIQKYYVRNKDGKIDHNSGYDCIEKDNCEGLWFVQQGNTIGYMDDNGEFVVPLRYDLSKKTIRGDIYHKSFGWPSWYRVPNTDMVVTDVYKNNCVGLIDNLGNELMPCQFEDVLKSEVSQNFGPFVSPTHEKNPKFVMGLYDIRRKKVCVPPQHDRILREQNGYSPFQNGKTWGLLHSETGIEVAPPIYLLDFKVENNGIAIAFLGGSWETYGNGRHVSPEECHVLVTHGPLAFRILSGYSWINFTGPSVVSCWNTKSPSFDAPHDTFKILKMPNYIAIIKNAQYQRGYFLKDGRLLKEWNCDCITPLSHGTHAKYLSGGTFSAKDYEGHTIPVTHQMKLEILKEICK